MKTKNLLWLCCCIGLSVSMYQCEKYGKLTTETDDEVITESDDSDTKGRGKDNAGNGSETDYGDLYVLLRDDNGMPEMVEVAPNLWVVQPIDENGVALELTDEGELAAGEEDKAIEVEFGRLNIVRSPQSVLDNGLSEALESISTAEKITLDFCGRIMIWNDDIVTHTIDSPRENLALYQYIMNSMLEEDDEGLYKLLGDFDPMMLAASCLAAGSDKTGTITIDEVVYINGFMDCVGINALDNRPEYTDIIGNDTVWKEYFNFIDYDQEGNSFSYSREDTYSNRYIQFQVWESEYYPIDEDGNCYGPIFPILNYFETNGLFTYRWDDVVATLVSGFALAADDAVQVLDYIHGNSNIIFLPEFDGSDITSWPFFPQKPE